MSDTKRQGSMLTGLMAKKSRTDEKMSAGGANRAAASLKNPFHAKPVQPERILQQFLVQARTKARAFLPSSTKYPVTTPFCEIEARLGTLKVNQKRVTSSGPKTVQNTIVQAFDVSSIPQQPSMESGVTRNHYVHWTQAGLSEPSPLAAALGCVISKSQDVGMIKRDLVETESIETVFVGYNGERRISVPGLVPARDGPLPKGVGALEYKEKLSLLDLTLPAAKYDLRLQLASEKVVDRNVTSIPKGWTSHRVKRRRSYSRRDKNIVWQIDVTEVTTSPRDPYQPKSVTYEIELELIPSAMLKVVNEEDTAKLTSFSKQLAQQLWWIMSQLNPMEDVVDVEERLQDHPNKQAVSLALATCGALKRFMDQQKGGGPPGPFEGPIATPSEPPSAALMNIQFCGCMPVNFSRHNIEEIQQSPENGYFLSEKTDGVRYFMIFTGDTAVLVDRAMKGKQPIPIGDDSKDPMAAILPLIQPGTVLDGEVVMHRGNKQHKARPIFIVFDVLCINATTPVLHLPFEQRLRYLKQATFRTQTASRDMFDEAAVANLSVALPLVRKNFVKRHALPDLISHVVEEKGLRSYRNGPVHNHLTDGIIFQPNLPYVCGTDVHLLKWKYLDTVTIDVELLPPNMNKHHGNGSDDDELRVGVLGEEGTLVDMTRFVKLPPHEQYRLEADRQETGSKIAEVGFDPEVGEWYYLTMRPDKIRPNHISTVLGTLLELSESLTAEELQFRMIVPPGARDTYRKDVRGMLKQLLDHQKRKHQQKR